MTTALDLSGHGKNGTYNLISDGHGGFVPTAFTAGLVPGDTAWAVPLVDNNYITVPDLTVSWLNAWSIEFWIQLSPTIDGINNIVLFISSGVADNSNVDIRLQNSI